MRLNRFLAMCGLGSRRACENLIRNGEVEINGERVQTLGVQVYPATDRVKVRGQPLRPATMMTYVALNKPVGYVTTARDELQRRTVLDIVHVPVRVYPVGRLDRDSEGLLLLTNDGELAYRLTHPRYKLPRVYRVLLDAPLTVEHARRLRRGVRIDGTYLAKGEIAFPCPGQRHICRVTIYQGRNRQVRKMFAALGYRTKALQRLASGPLQLGKLKIGAWRYLSAHEVRRLKEAVHLLNGNSR